MNTLKIYKQEFREIDSKIEFPIYLYYQDDLCFDELVKLTEDRRITIKHDYTGYTISVENDYKIFDLNENSITTKQHFEDTLKEAIDDINSIL